MNDVTKRVVPPGGTIGILGGGQLGRMTAMAAARLGYRSHIYCPDEDTPAAQVADKVTVASYFDRDALAAFGDVIDVVTYEFENVPTLSPQYVWARGVPVRPSTKALDISQNRMAEKYFLKDCGVPMVKWIGVPAPVNLAEAVEKIGRPSILKSARGGYDGKGQVRIGPDTDLDAVWQEMGGENGVLEAVADFVCEVSVIVARGLDGTVVHYGPMENRHAHGILDTTTVPARVDEAVAAEARRIAEVVAVELDVVGLLAVEMFVLADGKVLVNEIAPRPHNSGHWTIDACMTSQFEQHVRAICGVPLGSTERFFDAEMRNLLGDAIDDWERYLATPNARLHLYGKREARPGRKMGHVTFLTPMGGEP